MLKDWDFAQFFPNWNGAAGDETGEEQRSSTSTSSSGSPPKLHRRNESDSALTRHTSNGSAALGPPGSEALFGSRLNWPAAGRQRIGRGSDEESPVSLTEFCRKSSQLELRSSASDPAPPRRQKTDLLDVRRQQLKRELEERRRTTAAAAASARLTSPASSFGPRGSSLVVARPPLVKSSSEPCAPLAFASLRDRSAQVREGPAVELVHLYHFSLNNKHPLLLVFFLTAEPIEIAQCWLGSWKARIE